MVGLLPVFIVFRALLLVVRALTAIALTVIALTVTIAVVTILGLISSTLVAFREEALLAL